MVQALSATPLITLLSVLQKNKLYWLLWSPTTERTSKLVVHKEWCKDYGIQITPMEYSWILQSALYSRRITFHPILATSIGDKCS